MDQINIKNERLRDSLFDKSGNQILAYSIEIPQIEGAKSFNSFYKKLQDECAEFCQKKLPPKCNTDNVLSYRLTSKVHAENNRLTVALKVTLSNRTLHKIIRERTEKHLWDFEKGKFKVIKK